MVVCMELMSLSTGLLFGGVEQPERPQGGSLMSLSTGLLFGGVKSSLRDPKADLELAIFPSHLGIIVLSGPPLMEEMPGVISVVRVRGTRRQGRRRRCSIRGLAGPRKRTKTVIQNESIDKSE